MSITNLTTRVLSDGSALLQLAGPANRVVTWSVESGPGTVAPLTPATDAYGTNYAIYTPGGTTGIATIRATYGA